MNKTLGELAACLKSRGMPCRVEGDADASIRAVNTLEDAEPGEISFLANPKYARTVGETRATAVVVGEDFEPPRPMNLLRTKDPYAAVTVLIVEIHGYRRHPKWGLHPGATIADGARIGPNANIGPGVYIDTDVEIGARATIYPHCYVARGSRIGDDVVLYPNVAIYDDTILGHRVTIHAGSIIGEDGLGYAPVNNKWLKIPQVGRVVVADDVEIGANCTIDRATLGRTVVGAGTKFSNLIAIGHGTKIGEDCMLVAQVGVAGSVTVGRHVTMAGQVGVVGHVTIGDDVTVGAKAGVTNNVETGITVLGQPAVPIQDARRQLMLVQRLPTMKRQIKKLEEELKALRQQLGDQANER
ncbi:MAG: UDP-3-O-(3-hydroxymyristoyl)glucosamine N-acyltransferase [Phycisphaerae bacterium]|nr:UDP-3-O-(3-hydroxymyristoyl)glucosamine N-acyltransferase [Phycisphaerae bacterium]